jgi:hypothetical protein
MPTVTRRSGQDSPLFTIADRMRSLTSRNAVSGSPTSSNATRPFSMSASISTT